MRTVIVAVKEDSKYCLGFSGCYSNSCWLSVFEDSSVLKFSRKWGPCHHGPTRPQVADRGEGVLVLSIGAKILNKQWQRADRDWSSA